MSLTVYAISGAPSAWRVLLGLGFKGLDYDIQYLDFSKKEHQSESYRAINPRGTVPALVSSTDKGETTLYDSIAILAWLDREFPAKPLFGETAEQAAVIWQRVMDCSEHFRAATKALLQPIFFQGVTESNAALVDAADTLGKELQQLEFFLWASPYVAGENPSAADAVYFPEARMVKRALETHTELMSELGVSPQLSDYPNLAKWLLRVESLEVVAKTMPPHWQ